MAFAESDDVSLAGFLRNKEMAGVVVQFRSTGHVNFISKQEVRPDLRRLITEIRKKEMAKRGVVVPEGVDLSVPGAIPQVPMWYYDTAANTLQNGGLRPGEVEATMLNKEEIIGIVNLVWGEGR